LKAPGLYSIRCGSNEDIAYVGSALNLFRRLSTQLAKEQLDHWIKDRDARFITFLRQPEGTHPIDLLSMQKRLIQQARPRWNDHGPTAA
jgi:hypothetical protein